jgi:predicted deacylase
VHGDEKSGPIALLALVRQLKRIRHVRLLLFPVVNPYGFERGQRRSAGRVDLNRHAADPRPPQEARAILASLRRYSLAAFLSLHEDDVLARPYLHGYAHDERGTGIVTSIANTINRSHPLARNRRIHGLRNERGVILSPSRDGSFEDALHRSGAPVSICFEVPDRMPFARMIQTNIDAINALLAVVSPLSP